MEKEPWRALGAEQREAGGLAALVKSLWGRDPHTGTGRVFPSGLQRAEGQPMMTKAPTLLPGSPGQISPSLSFPSCLKGGDAPRIGSPSLFLWGMQPVLGSQLCFEPHLSLGQQQGTSSVLRKPRCCAVQGLPGWAGSDLLSWRGLP